MIPPFFGLWSSLIMGLSISSSLLLTQIINIQLHPLMYVGYVVITTSIYAFFGFLFDLLLVPLFVKYKIFSTIAYWILAYPICRLPHEILTYSYLNYTIFASETLTLLIYIVFHGFSHGVVFGALIILFLRIWHRHLRRKT